MQRLPFSADLHRSRFALRTPFQKQRGGIIECPRRRQPFAPAGLRAHEHIIARIGLFGKAEKTFTHGLRIKQRMKTALYAMQTTDIAKPPIALICRAGACLPPYETVDTRNGKQRNIAVSVLLQQEETRRVSDAVNSKMESDEALPERSDREHDATGRGDKTPSYELVCHAAAASPAVVRQCGRNLLFMR